jgi:hypothetical protein
MSDREAPGEKTATRLVARAARGLQRKDIGGGEGEVFSGPLASRALKAMGARAMTLDETVIVDEGFSTDSSEDQALYAHELVHAEGSGGAGAVGSRDSEEVTARAVESMVLHRSVMGESFGSIMRDMKEQGAAAIARSEAAHDAPQPTISRSKGGREAGKRGSTLGKSPAPGTKDEIKAAYKALLASGKKHDQIVRDLARYVIDAMRNSEDGIRFRAAPSRSL